MQIHSYPNVHIYIFVVCASAKATTISVFSFTHNVILKTIQNSGLKINNTFNIYLFIYIIYI